MNSVIFVGNYKGGVGNKLNYICAFKIITVI